MRTASSSSAVIRWILTGRFPPEPARPRAGKPLESQSTNYPAPRIARRSSKKFG